eukprot:sb/3466243/
MRPDIVVLVYWSDRITNPDSPPRCVVARSPFGLPKKEERTSNPNYPTTTPTPCHTEEITSSPSSSTSYSTTSPYPTTTSPYPTTTAEGVFKRGEETTSTSPSPTTTSPYPTTTTAEAIVKRGAVEVEILIRTNQYRALHGSPSLNIDTTIQASAAAHCSKLASENAFYHSSTSDRKICSDGKKKIEIDIKIERERERERERRERERGWTPIYRALIYQNPDLPGSDCTPECPPRCVVARSPFGLPKKEESTSSPYFPTPTPCHTEETTSTPSSSTSYSTTSSYPTTTSPYPTTTAEGVVKRGEETTSTSPYPTTTIPYSSTTAEAIVKRGAVEVEILISTGLYTDHPL